jgi:23S rRNA (pseudouridine1915-N3)-methyltransferase
MRIQIWAWGGRHDTDLATAIEKFTRRVNHHYACTWHLPAPVRNAASLQPQALADAESDWLLSAIPPGDFLVLLDERGTMIDSPALALKLNDLLVNATQRLHLVIGGAYGVNEALRQRAQFTWQLSKLVFPHQLVRLMVAEQLYRACTIIRGEKYHHG